MIARCKPSLAEWRATDRRWLALAALGVVDFLIVLDALAVAVALPTIQRELGFTHAELQWVVSAYGLTFGGFLLLAGRAGDFVDRRRLLTVGFVLFGAASVMGGLAPTAAILVAARALQGVGAAICAPTALALLTTLFAEQNERSRALAIWSVIGSFGLVAGAILGGLVTAGLGWRWILLLNAPVALVGVAFLRATIEADGPPIGRPRFDVAGALVVTTGVAALIYAATQLEQAGISSVRALGPFAAALLLLAAFPLIELRVAAPLLPLPFLRRRSLVGANITAFLLNGGFGGALFLTTLYLQQVLDFSALETGLAFVPLALATVIGGPVGSRLTMLIGPRYAAAAGLAVMAGGMAVLAMASAGATYLTDVFPGTMAIGLGVSAAYVPITVVAVDRIEPEVEGLASGLYQTTGQIGGALLVAVLAISAAAATASDLDDGSGREVALVAGFSFAFLVGTALLAVGALTSVALIETSPSSSSAPGRSAGSSSRARPQR